MVRRRSTVQFRKGALALRPGRRSLICAVPSSCSLAGDGGNRFATAGCAQYVPKAPLSSADSCGPRTLAADAWPSPCRDPAAYDSVPELSGQYAIWSYWPRSMDVGAAPAPPGALGDDAERRVRPNCRPASLNAKYVPARRLDAFRFSLRTTGSTHSSKPSLL
jgi:hypothetical protein